MPLPDRLRTARERLALTLADVAKETAIGVSSLSEFEHGKRDPSVSHLQKLAKLYEQTLSTFFEEEPTAAPVLLWRGKPESPVADRIEARFLKLCRQYANVENWAGASSDRPFQRLMVTDYPKSYPEVEQLAQNTWKLMGLGDWPGESLLRIVEEKFSVRIFHQELDGDASSASVFSDDFGPAVLLNQSSRRWRRNFDLAHELFHLVTWKSKGRPSLAGGSPDPAEEKFANAFASLLLMPDQSIRIALDSARSSEGKLAFDDLDAIARQFDVSHEALAWRVKSVYRLPGDLVKKYLAGIKGTLLLSDRESDTPPRFPARYVALAGVSLRNGEMSAGQFAEYVGVSRSEAEKHLTTDVPEPIQAANSGP